MSRATGQSNIMTRLLFYQASSNFFQIWGSVPFFDTGGMLSAGASGPSKTAIQRVLLLFSHANFSVMVNGMHRTTPIRPSRLPQKTSERNTTSVDRPSLRPMSLGSTDQYRNNRRNAFPLKPEYRRRPEHGEEHSDKEGHQDRLRLVDAPDDDHERRRDDKEADSVLRIALFGHGQLPLRSVRLFSFLSPMFIGIRLQCCKPRV
jgi:hypothetical protein